MVNENVLIIIFGIFVTMAGYIILLVNLINNINNFLARWLFVGCFIMSGLSYDLEFIFSQKCYNGLFVICSSVYLMEELLKMNVNLSFKFTTTDI
ncbi:hypothetical protein KUTeg_020024 [Tegillarca granosa]|uniref:NADH dehydrogenase subunit 4L n=1 Tax=Tegillarca granosa TaxID=220873 RepID=A0ABQ9EK64_TEGGR|nr:hypothetical protein KUTeg_020024 [Tegillarca granosa]